jgi:formiminotetrahydrofolate cyclodeaminase
MDSFKEYCLKLASTSPIPGGGSASGLTLAMAVSCVEKATRFSLEDKKNTYLPQLELIRNIALKLSNDDQIAFANWGLARKLPKITDEEKQIRKNKVEYYSSQCTRIPYEISKNSFKLIEIIEIFIKDCNKFLISDVGVGASLASSSFESGIFNILINIPYLKNENFIKELYHFIDSQEKIFTQKKENIYKICRKTLNS